jgi:hypothetical protein
MVTETGTPGEPATPQKRPAGKRRLTLSYNWFAGALISAFALGVLVTALAKGTPVTVPTADNAASSQQPTSAPTATAPPIPKAWVTVAHFAGRNTQKTTTFTVGSRWRAHLVNGRGSSNFIVDAVDPNNSSTSVNLANSIGTFDQVTQEYDAGTYYLDVEGDSWDITIENYQ